MFQFPTVRALAERLDAGAPASADPDGARAEQKAAGRTRLREQARRRTQGAEAWTAE
jgi:hypothetical protein